MLQFTRTKGLIAALVFTVGVALATDGRAESDLGKHEYDRRCAACHGPAGKGDGFRKPYLHQKPSDLTRLAKRSGGAFPVERVHEKVDGALEVGRASREMPCWGAEYKAEAEATYAEEIARDIPISTDAYVETRLAALVNHVRDLQVR